MRVRIIFRGLILFEFDTQPKNRQAGASWGTMRAWMINDPATTEFHYHTPRISLIGRDATGREITTFSEPIVGGNVELTLSGIAPTGVIPSQSFIDYVGSLSTIGRVAPGGPNMQYVSAEVTVPSGSLRAGDLVTWDVGGKVPVEVAFMNSNVRGYAANEVVVEVGDDSDFDVPTGQSLKIDTQSTHLRAAGLPREMQPLYRGRAFRDEVNPNTIEILVTNFSPQRRRAVPWSLHYQWLFDAAGYPRQGFDPAQFKAFETSAFAYDAAEAQDDIDAVNQWDPVGDGQPFPYLVTDTAIVRPPGLQDAGAPAVQAGAPPSPPGRVQPGAPGGPTIAQINAPPTDPPVRPLCLCGCT